MISRDVTLDGDACLRVKIRSQIVLVSLYLFHSIRLPYVVAEQTRSHTVRFETHACHTRPIRDTVVKFSGYPQVTSLFDTVQNFVLFER